MLLEDDMVDVMTVQRALKDLKVTNKLVRTANGEEAIVYLRDDNNIKPCVILLDLNMPGLSGLETIPRLRDMLPEVGIIALTLLDPRTYRQAALAAGAEDFVAKANLTTDLLPAIRRVMQNYGGLH